MALTYVYLTAPNAVLSNADLSRTYTASATGIVTGVTPVDAARGLRVPANLDPAVMLFGTGTTAERPDTKPIPALTGQANNQLAPPPGMPYYDTTLSSTVYYVSTAQASTGWVNQAGTAA